MVVTLAGRRQILVVSALRALGLTVEDGTLLWEYPWRTEYDVNSAQPLVIEDNRVFLSAGYGHGSAGLGIAAQGGEQGAANNRRNHHILTSVFFYENIFRLVETTLAPL